MYTDTKRNARFPLLPFPKEQKKRREKKEESSERRAMMLMNKQKQPGKSIKSQLRKKVRNPSGLFSNF